MCYGVGGSLTVIVIPTAAESEEVAGVPVEVDGIPVTALQLFCFIKMAFIFTHHIPKSPVPSKGFILKLESPIMALMRINAQIEKKHTKECNPEKEH